MKDNLKLTNKSEELQFTDLEKQFGFMGKEPYATIRRDNFYLTASAVDKLNLTNHSHCHLSLIGDAEEAERLYIRPNNDEATSRSNFLIIKGKDNGRSGAMISGTRSVLRAIPRLQAVLQLERKDRKIILQKCEKTNYHFVPLSPGFEHSIEDLANVPEHKAIYKICYNGHVQNIGETNNLARRLKEKKVEGVPIHTVYYSIMNEQSDDRRKYWETYHLEKYKKAHGAYPPYNHQAGRRTDN